MIIYHTDRLKGYKIIAQHFKKLFAFINQFYTKNNCTLRTFWAILTD